MRWPWPRRGATPPARLRAPAWSVRGQAVDERDLALDLTDEQWEERGGEWDLPAGWAFDVNTARRLGRA